MKSNSFCNHASDKQNRTTAKRFRFVNQGDDYRQTLDDTKSYWQLIINIILSEDLRRDKKLLKSKGVICLKFRLLRILCRCYGD